MHATRGHLYSLTSASNPARSPCVGVFSTSRLWDVVLGFESGSAALDISIGGTATLCFHESLTRVGRDSRVEYREAANLLRERSVSDVLVLCSGQHADSRSGTLFVVEDHLNWTGENPLIGMLDSERGERFLDMSCAYDPAICAALDGAARAAGIPVEHGVAVDGPCKSWPVDMSASRSNALVNGLALPVIAARHAGARVGAVAFVEQESGSSDGTSVDAKGYAMEGLRRFLEIATSSVAALSGV